MVVPQNSLLLSDSGLVGGSLRLGSGVVVGFILSEVTVETVTAMTLFSAKGLTGEVGCGELKGLGGTDVEETEGGVGTTRRST